MASFFLLNLLNFRLRRQLLLGLCALLMASPVAAQTVSPLPTGDGLQAIYYDGPNFERPMVRRRDAAIDFDWGQNEPAPGVSAEQFSVRWQGWLLPPVSGRYVLHVTADDGMRVWLNDHLVLNEWRAQRVSSFAVTVALTGGKPCKLRVEYFQDIIDTRARLAWTRPDAPASAVVTSRYLFTRNPGDFSAPPAAAAGRGAAANRAVAVPVPILADGGPVPKAAQPRPTPRPAVAATAPAADTLVRRRVADLTTGQEVTLPELRFERGQAALLPEARTALDALLPALLAQPALRLEVQGHTDNQGDAELNRQLSQQRAETVVQYLTAHGVAAGRLRAVGYGGTRPVADNADAAMRSKNRRVVLRRL